MVDLEKIGQGSADLLCLRVTVSRLCLSRFLHMLDATFADVGEFLGTSGKAAERNLRGEAIVNDVF